MLAEKGISVDKAFVYNSAVLKLECNQEQNQPLQLNILKYYRLVGEVKINSFFLSLDENPVSAKHFSANAAKNPPQNKHLNK